MRFSIKWWGIFVAALALLVSGCSLGTSGTHSTSTTTAPVTYTLPGGGACVQLGSQPQPPYTNVQASHDSYLAHSEPMVAENPNNPLNLVGGSKFFTDPQHYRFQIGYYTSFDGGCTWTDGGVFAGFAKNEITSDISFAFGNNNDVYALILNTNDRNESGISVLTSHDGGKTFGKPIHAYEDTQGQVFSDKPWIVVDRTNGSHRGDIYVVWSYDYQATYNHHNCLDPQATVSCPQDLGFVKSTDGGKTFSKVKIIDGSASFCTNPAQGKPAGSHLCDAALGATPVVLPDGTIAVMDAYVDLGNGSNPSRILVTTSPDGGTTWTTPVLAATITDLPGHFPHVNYRNSPLPGFAADPRTGQLYVAWGDYAHGDADVLLASSKDQGQTWTTPLRVNDDPINNGAQQFQPQLAVAPDGVVSVSFFDTRTDPQHLLIDTYLAQLNSAGVPLRPNLRVTTQSWDSKVDEPRDAAGEGFIGDYQGLCVDDMFVHPFWNETRTGSQEIFTAAVPSARPTP